MKIRCSPLLFVVFVAAASCLTLASTTQAQRLPSTVIPDHYTLTLTPDLKAATFTGVESIDVTLAEPTSHITLNSAEIAFQSVTVTAAGKLQSATVSLDAANEQATVTFPAQLPAGKATLAIAYTGILNNELRGFYLSKTAARNYAVTQFESTDARRAFPCFDEPAYKATYDVTLIVDAGDTAISNSPIETDTPGPIPGKHALHFENTPKMSTYLVAFLVGDFQCISGSSDGVAIRVCSTPDKVALTPYGLDTAQKVLHYYNNYFGIPYPLKKLDLIALPDFEAGAMENFGAITYRETTLLIDPKTATDTEKQTVAIDIAHEMAHQWFGDLVTMQWWDNLWLNEGFATWMESKAVAVLHPEWKLDQIVAADVNDALNIDSAPTTRAIRAKADTPDEINEMFDGIAYDKAGDVLLTVENYLGKETFRKGVHAYLSAHLYANATAEDFWSAQTAVSHKPVDKIMESLVAQPGAPILTFGSPSGGKVSVTQKRFFLSPSNQPNPEQKWTLPVCFKSVSANQACEVLTPADSTIGVPPASLFFANAGGKGYYRSAYPPSLYAALVANVETGLKPTERISLIGDQWAQVRANKATAGDYLNLVAALKADPNGEVVATALSGVNILFQRVAATPQQRAALSAWIRSTFAPQLAKLGHPASGESSSTRKLRSQLFGILGYYGQDPAVLAQARQIAETYLDDPAAADPNLSHTALHIAARNGDLALFDRLQKIYETTTNPELQETSLELLAEFQAPALVQRSLDYAVSSKVRNQDAAALIAAPLRVDETRDQAWKYIQANWDKVQAQFTTSTGAYVVGSAGTFCSADARENVKSFFSTHKVASAGVALTHALERIDGCIELRSLQEPNLAQWLATQSNP